MARAGGGEAVVTPPPPPERLSPGQLARRLALAAGLVVVPVLATGFVAFLFAKAIGVDPAWLAPAAVSVVAVGSYRFYVRRVEKRAVLELSREGAWREAGAGVLVGAGLFATVIAVLAAVGAYTIVGRGTWSGVATALVVSVGAAVVEEILFRGVLYRLVEAAFGSIIAILVSAALFGGLHLLSPHPSLAGSVAIALEAGILLACAYVLTRRLWFAMGIHGAWNFMQGGIFGAPVSGTPSHGLFTGSLSGPTWLSGGEFGPEASVVSIVVCVVAALAIARRAARAGSFVPRRAG